MYHRPLTSDSGWGPLLAAGNREASPEKSEIHHSPRAPFTSFSASEFKVSDLLGHFFVRALFGMGAFCAFPVWVLAA